VSVAKGTDRGTNAASAVAVASATLETAARRNRVAEPAAPGSAETTESG
jgi:hypothetical protein